MPIIPKLITCQLCGKEKVPGKSHIFPKSFFKLPADEKRAHLLISSNKNEYQKKSRTGFYDMDIICLDCEPIFCPWDTYASEFLKAKNHPKVIKKKGDPASECIETDFDYPKLKLFFMSLLLRAHYSKQLFFNKVKLGVHEKLLKQFILSKDPGRPEDFSVVLSNFTDFFDSTSGGFNPFRNRFDGVLAYRFSLGTYQALIKVDQQNFKKPFSNLILSPIRPLVMVPRKFLGSKAHNQMVKDIHANEKRNHSKNFF